MIYEKCEMKDTTNEMNDDGKENCDVLQSGIRWEAFMIRERASEHFLHDLRHLIKYNEHRIVKHIHIIYTLQFIIIVSSSLIPSFPLTNSCHA
jgi:hypothetical protein